MTLIQLDRKLLNCAMAVYPFSDQHNAIYEGSFMCDNIDYHIPLTLANKEIAYIDIQDYMTLKVVYFD